MTGQPQAWASPGASKAHSLHPIRRARSADRRALSRLLAPAVASGAILPTDPDPERFLVAEGPRGLVGAVALTPWTREVTELGSLVSAETGCGLGTRLVQAAVAHAAAEGFATVVALTGLGDWFGRRGFAPAATPPWALARAPHAPAETLPGLVEKAQHSCRVCPRLARCTQALVAKDVRAPGLQVAA